jgi:two-component system cell cycle response regulator DivK
MSSARPAPQTSAHASTSARPLVLLVDDFQDAREMYADYLEISGFDTAQAVDGHEALTKARGLKPAVVLMDLSLPGIDGWEVTRRLKADAGTRDIAIVALTAHALEGERARALNAGCDSFVSKPCLPQQLVDEIVRLLGRGPAPA